MEPQRELTLHATTVCLNGRGALIRGASGSGKSALALELLSRGARLVADDRTMVQAMPQGLVATAPAAIRGLIEARGIGILRADAVRQTLLTCIVDLDRTETDRMPQVRHEVLLGVALPLLHPVAAAYFPAALIQYIIHGLHT